MTFLDMTHIGPGEVAVLRAVFLLILWRTHNLLRVSRTRPSDQALLQRARAHLRLEIQRFPAIKRISDEYRRLGNELAINDVPS